MLPGRAAIVDELEPNAAHHGWGACFDLLKRFHRWGYMIEPVKFTLRAKCMLQAGSRFRTGGCHTASFLEGTKSWSPNFGTGNSLGACGLRCRARFSPVNDCSSIFCCKVIRA